LDRAQKLTFTHRAAFVALGSQLPLAALSMNGRFGDLGTNCMIFATPLNTHENKVIEVVHISGASVLL